MERPSTDPPDVMTTSIQLPWGLWEQFEAAAKAVDMHRTAVMRVLMRAFINGEITIGVIQSGACSSAGYKPSRRNSTDDDSKGMPHEDTGLDAGRKDH